MRETPTGSMLSRVTERIDVAMTPAEAALLARADAYAVIDVLRATTTIATLFSGGLRELRIVDSLDAGLQARSEHGGLLFGEKGGLRPEGFDYGNSPAEAASLDVGGKSAVLVTSNGTRALCAVASLGPAVAAALVNTSAVASFLTSRRSVVIVCAGNGGARRFSLEDFGAAAAIVRKVLEHSPGASLGDAARLAADVTDVDTLVSDSEHAAVTRSLGFHADIEFALSRDLAPSLPMIVSHGEGWAKLRDANAVNA